MCHTIPVAEIMAISASLDYIRFIGEEGNEIALPNGGIAIISKDYKWMRSFRREAQVRLA
jgi:hypothetical protein